MITAFLGDAVPDLEPIVAGSRRAVDLEADDAGQRRRLGGQGVNKGVQRLRHAFHLDLDAARVI